MRTLKLNKVRISAFLGAVALMMMVTFFAVNAMTVQAADTATEETVATEKAADNSISGKAVAAAVAVGLAAMGGGLGMGIAVSRSTEAIARQTEATNDIRGTLMLGLVFIETAIIYALIVSILVIFVM